MSCPLAAWSVNTGQQSPCEIVSSVYGSCSNNTSGTISPTSSEDSFVPVASNATLCTCSWASYNLLSACTFCATESPSLVSWDTWIKNCDGLTSTTTYFPWDSGIRLPSNAAIIPYYASSNLATPVRHLTSPLPPLSALRTQLEWITPSQHFVLLGFIQFFNSCWSDCWRCCRGNSSAASVVWLLLLHYLPEAQKSSAVPVQNDTAHIERPTLRCGDQRLDNSCSPRTIGIPSDISCDVYLSLRYSVQSCSQRSFSNESPIAQHRFTHFRWACYGFVAPYRPYIITRQRCSRRNHSIPYHPTKPTRHARQKERPKPR
ncbi:uncharacterized protein BJ212DRAFT_368571 [Suillus subaureus]|uniref:Uncharacterized protein n=1 Tax=Suillus subaureus TaxID=48587 RepID=A0A9P7E8K4_9AGAM|nr:uncharacterized protein BJ212DRAFT_368571 [Suillus subaureus]KAG1814371.1 hypothetical protein BJ212DRAFT_368571 [Suillus subaureus]